MFYYEKDKKLEIPIGSYEIEDLERFINEKIKDKVNSVPVDKKELLGENSIVLRGNRQTLKSEIICRYNIDFKKPNNIGKMLGFKDVLLPAYKKAESNSLVDIMSTDLLQITCNVAGGSWTNDKPSHVIHTFVIDVSPGYKLLSVPKNLIYHPINCRDISLLEVRICDQNLNLVDFRGERINVSLHLKCL